jgi:hypothetical protein
LSAWGRRTTMRATLMLLLGLVGSTDALRVGQFGVRATPRSRVLVATADPPTAKWTLAKIRRYVSENGLDIKTSGPGRTKKVILRDIAQCAALPPSQIQPPPPPPTAEAEKAEEVEQVDEAAAPDVAVEETEAKGRAEAEVEAETAASELAAAVGAEAAGAEAEDEAQVKMAAKLAEVPKAVGPRADEAVAKEEVPTIWRRNPGGWRSDSVGRGGDTVPGFKGVG